LILAPDGDDHNLSIDEQRNNAFRYQQPDPTGLICPIAAHIRKANPRDATSRVFGESLNEASTLTHRLLRRGVPYGSLAASSPDKPAADDVDRGLLFLAYQTSFVRQFEHIITAWANDVNFSEPQAGWDPIIGQNSAGRKRSLIILVDTPVGVLEVPVPMENEWVIPTGGGYYFAPSIAALKRLSAAR
jgi:deferrochelatase/peroxidase EfeB